MADRRHSIFGSSSSATPSDPQKAIQQLRFRTQEALTQSREEIERLEEEKEIAQLRIEELKQELEELEAETGFGNVGELQQNVAAPQEKQSAFKRWSLGFGQSKNNQNVATGNGNMSSNGTTDSDGAANDSSGRVGAEFGQGSSVGTGMTADMNTSTHSHESGTGSVGFGMSNNSNHSNRSGGHAAMPTAMSMNGNKRSAADAMDEVFGKNRHMAGPSPMATKGGDRRGMMASHPAEIGHASHYLPRVWGPRRSVSADRPRPEA